MTRPDVDAILEPLTPFQRRTVEHAFRRLFLAEDSTARFLVADEVGLGKTLVARGVIARTIDHLWEDVDRIDVVYICSNGSIARSNLPKLQIGDTEQRSFALATRLTMLATEFASPDGRSGLDDIKLNFVSFTPGTSFNMGHSAGQQHERRVLFHLLSPCCPDRRTGLMNLLQGRVSRKDAWRWRLENEPCPIDPTIRARFETAFREREDLQGELHLLVDTWFSRYRRRWPADARLRRDRVISSLRRLLADECITALEPDLLIVDEFQRFKSLLESRQDLQDPGAELAQKLFRAEAHDGQRVRTLLLSATPYKLYTSDAEIEHEDHYGDFLHTTRFLLGGDDHRVSLIRQRLSRFGSALKRAAAGEKDQVGVVESAKSSVERSLRAIMARTERVGASADHDAMVDERQPTVAPAPVDVRQYLASDALFRCVDDHDPMPLWKSASYLVHFMQGYRFNERLDAAIALSPQSVVAVLRRYGDAFLDATMLRAWGQIDPGSPKLRAMTTELLDAGLWRLLWMPPTFPYWPLEGPFAGKDAATKTLLFSAWNVVPDVVSALLSYEAERRMVGGRIASYENPAEQQRPLLRLTQSTAGVRSRHRLLLLLLPCLPLADRAHPLEAPDGQDRRAWVRGRVEEILSDPRLPNPQDGGFDDRWEWAALLMLDPHLRTFLREWREADPRDVPNPEVFPAYVDDLLSIKASALGRRPPNLAELLTEAALGSPAILASRCLRCPERLDDATRRRLAGKIAYAFWSLFNQPAVISLMRQLAGTEAGSEESAYWRLVLRYCRQGNLQAVLDEQWHLLWEQSSWSEGAAPAEIAASCTEALVQAIHPVRSRVHARFYQPSGSAVQRDEVRVRTVFALRFGHIRDEESGYVSQDAVRNSFNSPFRPFVLTSTSIGQEGLDFHPWCHRIVHWNLPGNPVDLEQREGRVHRYKGHAVRRNVAAGQAGDAVRSWRVGDDLWAAIFDLAEQAARANDENDLVPRWVAPGPHRVMREVPMLPYTSEVEAFARLKRQLAAYRVVFGQPRQQELVTLLDQSKFDSAQLRSWTIDISPPAHGS